MLHGAGLFSLPQVVIDGEIVEMIQRLLRGAEVTEDAVMNAVTERVGFDGDFLRQKETSRRLRAGDVYQPRIATRVSIEAWERAGRDEFDRARERARDIVAAAEERGPVLPAATSEALRAVAAEALAAGRAVEA
jgi:trimethylamine:corrinoid methyltransferase-like protein